MFNIERFHNEIAMRLGYERIVKDKRVTIKITESDDPWVTLRVQGYDDIRFLASDIKGLKVNMEPIDLQNEIKYIVDTIHQAYKETFNSPF